MHAKRCTFRNSGLHHFVEVHHSPQQPAPSSHPPLPLAAPYHTNHLTMWDISVVATWWVFFLVGALAWDGLGATTTARGEPALPSRCRSMGVSSSRGFTTGREVSHLVECSSHYVGYTLIVPHSGEASGWGYCGGGVVLLRGY